MPSKHPCLKKAGVIFLYNSRQCLAGQQAVRHYRGYKDRIVWAGVASLTNTCVSRGCAGAGFHIIDSPGDKGLVFGSGQF